MTAADPTRKLAALLRGLRAAHGELAAEPWLPPPADGHDPLIHQFIYSFLLWEWRAGPAAVALDRLLRTVVDANELRVCLPEEIAAAAGDTTPHAIERASRMRAALNEVYRREHIVTLAPAAALAKRDARAYLESLEGVPAFVAARMVLLALGGHAFPLDDRLHAALDAEQALPPALPLADAAGWLERHFHAGEAAPAYLLMEAWLDALPEPAEPAPRPDAERDTQPGAQDQTPPKRRRASGRADAPKQPRSATGGKRAEP